MKFETIKEATQHWVNGFNAIPYSLIERAYKDNIDDLIELTPITVGDYVWSNDHQTECEVISINREEKTAVLNVDEEEVTVDLDELNLENDSWLPMWGWLWMFGERIDEDWARENLEEVAECGFRIFEDADSGDIYIGIDGAGYDFYEQHWIPLYNARGLRWHKGE